MVDPSKVARTAFSKFLAASDISSRYLSESTGYSISAVKAWRTGIRRPSKGAQRLIAQALQIDGKRLTRLLR